MYNVLMVSKERLRRNLEHVVFVGATFPEIVRSDLEPVVATRGDHIRLGPAQLLKVGGETVRAALRDIYAVSHEAASAAEVICVGRLTCYHTSIRQETKMKREIGRKSVQLIRPNTTLACGSGSTVAYCVKRLVEGWRYHVIVTNNVGIIDQVGASQLRNFVFVGGEYNAGIHSCVGDGAVKGFERAPCHVALIGVSGINADGELFVRHSEEIAVVNRIVRRAKDCVYIVADARKHAQIDVWRYTGTREAFGEKAHIGEEELRMGKLDEFSQWAQGHSEIWRDFSYGASERARQGARSLRIWPMMSSRRFGTFAREGRFEVRCKTYHVDSVDSADVASFAYN